MGSAALGAVNTAVPFITSAAALVSMFPTGGAAIIVIRMGHGDKEGANNAFMTLVYTSLPYSTKGTRQPDIIAICRGIVVKAAAIFCITVIFGNKTIGAAPLVAVLITFAIAVILAKKTKIVY